MRSRMSRDLLQVFSKIWTLTKKFVQKLNKKQTKIIRNTKFVYNLYSKCTSNSYVYTGNAQTVQNLYKVQTKNGLKLEMYVFCTYKQCTHYAKLIQVAN